MCTRFVCIYSMYVLYVLYVRRYTVIMMIGMMMVLYFKTVQSETAHMSAVQYGTNYFLKFGCKLLYSTEVWFKTKEKYAKF